MSADACELGDVELLWDREDPLVQVLDGHGVYLLRQDGGNDCGVIDRESSTLISRNGGTGIDPGDRLLHNAEYCELGRERRDS